jgi:uncharacterized membrane protein
VTGWIAELSCGQVTLVKVVVSIKILVVCFGGDRASPLLPYLGISVLLLFVGSWATTSLFFLRG